MVTFSWLGRNLSCNVIHSYEKNYGGCGILYNVSKIICSCFFVCIQYKWVGSSAPNPELPYQLNIHVRSLYSVAVSGTLPLPLATKSCVKCVQLWKVNLLHPYTLSVA